MEPVELTVAPRTRSPPLTFTVSAWLLKPPSWRTPAPSLLMVPPAVMLELIASPTCSLECPAVPWTAVRPPATWATVTVAVAGKLRRPLRLETTRTSSSALALMVSAVSVSVRTPWPVVTAEPPEMPPCDWKASRLTVSLKPFRSQAAPPRTVTMAVSAILADPRFLRIALAKPPVSAPEALPPVKVMSPVTEFPEPV